MKGAKTQTERNAAQDRIWERVKKLEHSNFMYKKFTSDEVVSKIKKIIEEESK